MNKLAAETFLETLKGCIPKGNTSLSLETPFSEIVGWDSMVRLSVIAAIDNDFGLDVNSGEIRRCPKLGDLFRLLEQKSSC